MKLLKLFWRLLRYRVAIMLILFLLLSISIHENLTSHSLQVIFACLALAFSYISATSINDIADAKIDAINHPYSIGRPLIVGAAKTNDLINVFIISSAISLLFASLIDVTAVFILLISILINVCYSLPPIKFSYRTFFAPVTLGLAYVGVPYALGIDISRSPLHKIDLFWFLGLYLLFVGRIILKDFRDRKGDSKYHKPTFLLRFGKNATCKFSYSAVILGGILLLWINRSSWLTLVILIYLSSIIFMLRKLQLSSEGKQEQLSIGVGAKMGNGLLITLFCELALKQAGVELGTQIIIVMGITILFLLNLFAYLRDPEAAVIGYKG